MAEVRFIRYLTVDIERTICGLRLNAGLAVEIVQKVPCASPRTGPYGGILWETEALLCEVVGRPEIQVVLSPDFVSEQCPEEVLAEGMGRPGHVYEWEARS